MMEDYRLLTNEEILILEEHGCTAEDWTATQTSMPVRTPVKRLVVIAPRM